MLSVNPHFGVWGNEESRRRKGVGRSNSPKCAEFSSTSNPEPGEDVRGIHQYASCKRSGRAFDNVMDNPSMCSKVTSRRTLSEHTANTCLPSACQTGPPQATSDQAAGVGAKLCRDGKLARQFQDPPRCVSLGPPGSRRMTTGPDSDFPHLLSPILYFATLLAPPARQHVDVRR